MTVAVIPSELSELAEQLAAKYVAGSLRIVAGAGVSRASQLPGWLQMAASIEKQAAELTKNSEASLNRILTEIHGNDIIGRTDTIRRLVRNGPFARLLHTALYATGEPIPSASHWHLTSMMDAQEMPDLYTANFDDLLEVAHKWVGTGGRIRHFHGKLPFAWSGKRLASPPIVTTRDYAAAERQALYDSLASDLNEKTVLLVGLSLTDPNLVRVIREHAVDCRAVLIATRGDLTDDEQTLRLRLLERFWLSQQVTVVAVEEHALVPAFLVDLRRRIVAKHGIDWYGAGCQAWKDRIVAAPQSETGQQTLQKQLSLLVKAAKSADKRVGGDRELHAGLFLIERDGWLVQHSRSGMATDAFLATPRRRLNADPQAPWGVAGYSFAAGVPAAAAMSGSAFDRNVPRDTLIEWQNQRAKQSRLPAASVLCMPVWAVYGRRYQPVGVIYLASSDGSAFEGWSEPGSTLPSLLRAAAESIVRTTPSGDPLP